MLLSTSGRKTTKVSHPLTRSNSFIKHRLSDPIFISVLGDILENIASSSMGAVYPTVVQRSLPVITTALASAQKTECWITSSGIDLITSLINGAKYGVGEGFFATVAPTLFATLNVAEDRDVLQVSLPFLTATLLVLNFV